MSSPHSKLAASGQVKGVNFGDSMNCTPLTWDFTPRRAYHRAMARRLLGETLNDRLEAVIRRYPEQYLWMHRKWRE